jgi:hypothetical protein
MECGYGLCVLELLACALARVGMLLIVYTLPLLSHTLSVSGFTNANIVCPCISSFYLCCDMCCLSRHHIEADKFRFVPGKVCYEFRP